MLLLMTILPLPLPLYLPNFLLSATLGDIGNFERKVVWAAGRN